MDLRQLPALAGPIVVVYSKDVTGTLGLEVDAGLNLSMEMVADMFAGRTLYWDHEDVRALNPHVALPHERIHAVVRSDKSGMTGTFTAGQLASLASRMRMLYIARAAGDPTSGAGMPARYRYRSCAH